MTILCHLLSAKRIWVHLPGSGNGKLNFLWRKRWSFFFSPGLYKLPTKSKETEGELLT
jgi:hypothetical protein